MPGGMRLRSFSLIVSLRRFVRQNSFWEGERKYQMSLEAKNIILGILHMEYVLISHKLALMQYTECTYCVYKLLTVYSVTEMIVYDLASN